MCWFTKSNLKVQVWFSVIRVGADITLLRERELDYDSDRNTRKIAEVLVRKVPDDQQVRFCPSVRFLWRTCVLIKSTTHMFIHF